MGKEKATGETKKQLEFERRFAVLHLPLEIKDHFEDFNPIEIQQGYLPDGLRIRKSVGKNGKAIYASTIKTVVGSDGILREEEEHIISTRKFKRDWEKTKNARIYKTRYYIPYESLIIELDIFKGKDLDGQMVTEGINGRMLAEIESKTDKDLITGFDQSVLSWLGADLTQMVSNRKIALGLVEIPALQEPTILR